MSTQSFSFIPNQLIDSPFTASVTTSTGTSAGAIATVAGIGSAIDNSAFSSTGATAAVSGKANALFGATATSSGATATAAGVGKTSSFGAGASAGDATAAAASNRLFSATGSETGATATVAATGASLGNSVFGSAGDSTVAGVSPSGAGATANGAGTSAADSTAAGAGASLGSAVFGSTGQATASGVGSFLQNANGIFISQATATALAAGAAIANASFSSAGTSTAAGISETTAPAPVAATAEVGAGRPSRRRYRFIARWKGEDHVFATPAELQAFVESTRTKAQIKRGKRPAVKIVVSPAILDEMQHFDLPSIVKTLRDYDWRAMQNLWDRYQALKTMTGYRVEDAMATREAAQLRLAQDREDEELLLL